jgi:hypothetical protein
MVATDMVGGGIAKTMETSAAKGATRELSNLEKLRKAHQAREIEKAEKAAGRITVCNPDKGSVISPQSPARARPIK